ncbi:MAG: hypothetical protein H6Q90_6081 [Deltaproteobacteria bacterium]|nr:hypothetical protein [Deltaproteobacteria bacterium]
MTRLPAINQFEHLKAIRNEFDGVKVFSATKARDREALGDAITTWIDQHPERRLVDKIVTQSSDSEFHCLTITLFYRQLRV